MNFKIFGCWSSCLVAIYEKTISWMLSSDWYPYVVVTLFVPFISISSRASFITCWGAAQEDLFFLLPIGVQTGLSSSNVLHVL